MTKTSLEELMPDAPDDAIELLEKMLEYDPNSRLTAKECLEHKFFSDYTPKFFSKSKKPMFNTSPYANKNNKLLNSKFIRMNSKKFEDERKKSPIPTKTPVIDKPMVTKNLRYPQVGRIKNVSLDRGGFYMKNKPVKSPATSNSPNNSKGFSGNNSYANNRYGGAPLYQSKSIFPKKKVETKPSAVTIASLRMSRNLGGTAEEPYHDRKKETSLPSNITPPPVKVPNLTNQSLGMFQSSGLGAGGLGGGGLSRASGMSLGRHQV